MPQDVIEEVGHGPGRTTLPDESFRHVTWSADRDGHDEGVRILDTWSARSAERLGATQVFRPPIGILVTALWVVVTLLWAVVAATAGWGALAGQVPLMLLLATLVHAACGRPLVAVGPDGVLLRNVFRDVRVPWSALAAVDTRYALTLSDHAGRRFRAWAAPAPSRLSTARATPSDLRSVGWDPADGPIPVSATLRSDAGAAAALIRRYWAPPAATSSTHEPTTRPGAAAEVRWAVGVLVCIGLAAVATAVVLVLP